MERVGDEAVDRVLDGLGRFGFRWKVVAALLLAVMGLGGYAYVQQLIHGDAVTGMRTIGAGGAAWGLYVVFVAFFMGLAFAGICLASVIRVFGLETLRPISRAAELMTITALMAGGACVVADWGQPMRGLLFMPMYARPVSPFFWTFSLVVGGYFFSSAVYFYLSSRVDAAAVAAKGGRFRKLFALWAVGYRGTPGERLRRRRVGFWLAAIILPLLIGASSVLGFVFGTQGARPGWFTALQGPGFVVMAGVSGVATLILIVAGLRHFLRLEEVIPVYAVRWLANLLLSLTSIYLYFMIAEEVTASYAASAPQTRVAHETLFGAYAPLFWLVVASLGGCIVILFSQFAWRKTSIPWAVAAALLVNVGSILRRYIIVVPSQTHGMLLPYEAGSYAPTWVEYCVVAGLLSAGVLLFMTFLKFFPVVPVQREPDRVDGPVPPEPGGRRWARRLLFMGTLGAGLAMMIAGFFLSARYGTEPFRDPVVPFSPAVFIAGIVTCFLSAVVFEVFPAAPVRRADLN